MSSRSVPSTAPGQMENPRRRHIVLGAILALNLILGLFYSVTTPILEASDEISHYPLVQHLAANGLSLPVLDPANPGPWRQEGGQPPLYYFLAALATMHIDASDLPLVRETNPHADIGVIHADGNAHMIMHDPTREAFPWQGAVLAIHVARLLSVLMGTATVLTTYLIGREVFPNWPEVALGGAAFNAFLPMFLFVSGSVNNDNLSNLVSGLLIWQLARLLRAQTAPGSDTYTILGVLTGVGMLSKLSFSLLLPVVVLALLALSLRTRSWRPVIVGGVIAGGLTILIAGWWYGRNGQLYGDPTALNVFLDTVGERAPHADLAQLWSERESFVRTWWGLFGGVNVPLPDAIYMFLNIFGGVGLIGFTLYLLKTILWQRTQAGTRQAVSLLPFLLIVFWPTATLIGLLQWTSVTWASQGRLMFVAVGPICLWIAVGWAWWLRQKWQGLILACLSGAHIVIAAVAPSAWIAPAYSPPALDQSFPPDLPGEVVDFYEPGAALPTLRLLGYAVYTTTTRPGGNVELTLYWEVMQPPTRRWSLFAHAIDGAGLIAGQRDRYPGRGLLATERLQPGQRWSESLVIPLPMSVYTPDELAIWLGFYDLATDERMATADGSDSARLETTIRLLPLDPESDFPNARQDNFSGLIALRGYAYNARRLAPGGTLEVTLYWQGQQAIPHDYTVFVHVVDARTFHIYGGSDAQPAAWTRPTSTWIPGETVIDAHTITLDPVTPPGVYQIEVGLYTQPQPGVFERLRITTVDQQGADVLYLAPIAVEAAPGGEE